MLNRPWPLDIDWVVEEDDRVSGGNGLVWGRLLLTISPLSNNVIGNLNMLNLVFASKYKTNGNKVNNMQLFMNLFINNSKNQYK